MAQMEQLLAEKAARNPAQHKISSGLLYMQSGRFDSAPSRAAGIQTSSLATTDGQGRVLVDILGDMSKLGGRGKIEALGGTAVDVRRASARAWMTLDRLEELASETAVRSIHAAFSGQTSQIDKPGEAKRRSGTREERVAAVKAAAAALAEHPRPRDTPNPFADGAVNAGSKTSEGDNAHAAIHARNFFAVDGTGVNVGVLSDSDDFKEASIGSGDLPADTVTVPGESGRDGTGEGTAMMEIVHDIAPGAKLFFATAGGGPESFADNIRTLRFVYHCDVIIDDFIYFFESPYEDDIIAQAVNDVTADGAMYFSSASNAGNFDDGTSGTWEGDFKPSGALATLPSGYTVHSFGSGVISNRVEFPGGPLLLHWSDPGTLFNPASSNDYDIFVLDPDLRNVVIAATDIQDGSGLPFELIRAAIRPGLRVVVAAKPGAQLRAIHAVLFGGEFAISTPGSSWGHSATVDAYSVAAVDAAEAAGGEFAAGPTTPVEIFSSDGPRRIFYRPDNTPINADKPGVTFASGGGSTRAKPDIAAADGVTTTLPGNSGLSPFFGTSAAAPHAGAIASLLKGALPTKTPAQIRAAILTGALDIGALGPDRNTGRGLISAFNTLSRGGVRAAVNLIRGAVTVRPLGVDVVLPGSSAQLNVEVVNIGGAAGTAVTSTLTSSSPDVLILQGSSAYPTVGGEGSATNATPFAFFVSPTVPCGSLLPFTLTLNYTGNGRKPVALSFVIQTGRPNPNNTPVPFSYTGPPVAIPDGSPLGVDIPLPVTFPGGVSRVTFSFDGSACSATAGATTVGVDHSWVGDLTFRLTSPSGRIATLISAPGGTGNSGNNFCQTVLDDAAANSLDDVLIEDAPFTGTFKPTAALSVFAGDAAAGTWMLHAQDDANADSGSVRAFTLNVIGFTCP